MDYKNEAIQKSIKQFGKVINQYAKYDAKPRDYGTNELLYNSEIHMIQAIGSKMGETVTELSQSFGITKGGVSQTVSKLVKKGYILKEHKSEYGKEIILLLTDKGKKAFDVHEQSHSKVFDSLVEYMKTLSDEKINGFESILDFIGEHTDRINTK